MTRDLPPRKTLVDTLRSGFRQHLVDNAALTASAVPFFAAVETTVSDMTWQESLTSRAAGFAIGLGGAAFLFARGSDVTRRLLNVTDMTSELIQGAVDTGYCAAFNFLMQLALYPLTTNKTLDESVVPALYAGATGAALGIANRAALSIGRDLMGIERCERTWYPQRMRDLSQRGKRATATGLIAGAIALTAGIYAATAYSS